MFDFIPTADNNISDSIFFSPSLSFTVAITVLVFFLTATTSEEVKILIPFFLNDFCNSLEISLDAHIAALKYLVLD